MTSNSANMTVEEMLIQRLKDDHLAALITNEDAMFQLARRAVEKALFSEVKDTYGHLREPSAVTKAAIPLAKEIMAKVAEKLAADPEFIKACGEAFVLAMPDAIHSAAYNMAASSTQAAKTQIFNDMRSQGLRSLGINT